MSGALDALAARTTDELAQRPRAVLAELGAVFERFDAGALRDLARAVLEAGVVVCAGQGRSGMVARALAVRLGHLGVDVHVAGEATAPAIGGDGLLIALSRSGATAITLHQAAGARAAGARVAVVTARPGSPLAQDAEVVAVLPEPQPPSRQHAGSLFEQAALVLADSLAAVLQDATGQSDAALAARHDNLQ